MATDVSRVFCRYDLRTTDPDAARIFYSEVVGLDLPNTPPPEDSSMVAVWLLHERARARGAPPHWLGQIGVPDIEATVHRLVELGSEHLGPTVPTNDGTTAFAVLRDPLGAVVGLRGSTERSRPRRTDPVVWHQLHTTDVDRSWAVYSEICGWTHTETLDSTAGPDPVVVGGHRMFAWDNASKSVNVGSMANTARLPGVHPHWLFYFEITDIEKAMAKVRARGGRALDAVALPNGDRIAACEDGQEAAFGLYQSASR